MATEDILIRYRADVSQLTADLDKLVKQQEDLVDATKDTNTAINKSVSAQEYAAKKRVQLLETEQEKLKTLKQAQKLAFDPTEIQKFNNQIAESQKRIELLGGKVKGQSSIFKSFSDSALSSIKGIGVGLAAAFSFGAIKSFAEESFAAFQDAEKSANKLKFAIVDIGGQSINVYDKLIAQSEALQKITIFSDDDIQNAQTLLANFGLTGKQIEDLIPKLADFATVTGTDIASAAQQVGAGLEGAGREFKKYGIEVDASKSRQENFNNILNGFTKFAGSAAAATQTVSGKLAQQRNEVNNLQEQLGERLAPAFLKIQQVGLKVLDVVTRLFGIKQQTDLEKTTSALRAQQSEFIVLSETLKKTNISQEVRKNLIQEINDKYGKYLPNLLTEKSSLKDIEEAQKAVNKQIEGRILLASLEKEITKVLEETVQAQGLIITQEKELSKNKLNTNDNAAAANAQQKLSNDLIKLGTKQIGINNDKIVQLKETYKRLADSLGIVTDEVKTENQVINDNSKDAKKAAEERLKQIQALEKQLQELNNQEKKLKIEGIQPETFDEAIDKINQLKKIEEDRINADIAGKKKAANGDKGVIDALEKVRLKQLEILNLTTNVQELDVFKKITEAAQKAQDELAKLNIQIGIEVATEDVKAATDKVAKAFDELGKSITVSTSEKAQQAVMNETDALNAALQEQAALRKKAIEDQARLDAAAVTEFTGGEDQKTLIYAKAQDEINKIDKETNASITKNNKDANDAIKKNTEDTKAAVLDSITQQAQEFSNLFNEVTGLYNQFAEQQVQSIEKVRDAQLAAIDESLKANQDAYEARAITEREAVENERQLQADRVKAEEEAQKKIREIKRKQAILDKAAALVSIAINTAVAVSKITAEAALASPFLIPLIIAQGAAQAAAVIAQPIPYRKGSKDTGRKGHMARVGEEGEEIVYMPQNSKVLPSRQTRKYGEVIDAMFDNNLDKYINKHYITPALVAQKRAYEGQQSKNFADNMAQSIYYNQTGLTASDLESQRKRGQYIRNVDELANAIAKHIPKYDPYRA